jgi:hypothetical protein
LRFIVHLGFSLDLPFDPETGRAMFLKQVGWLSPEHMASYPRTHVFTVWEFFLPLILGVSMPCCLIQVQNGEPQLHRKSQYEQGNPYLHIQLRLWVTGKFFRTVNNLDTGLTYVSRKYSLLWTLQWTVPTLTGNISVRYLPTDFLETLAQYNHEAIERTLDSVYRNAISSSYPTIFRTSFVGFEILWRVLSSGKWRRVVRWKVNQSFGGIYHLHLQGRKIRR